MKKLLLKLMALGLVTALLVISCKKKDPIVEPAFNNDTQSLNSFLKKHAPVFETFMVNAETGGIISTSKGSSYRIPANGFVNSTGQVVTGDVMISVKEISMPAEMIFDDKPTVTAEGLMLESYGEFFVKATQNNQPLKLKDSGIVAVIVAKQGNTQGIDIWSGDTVINETLNGYDYQNNAISVSRLVSAYKGVTWAKISGQFAFPNSPTTLAFIIDSLSRWTNCDVLFGDPRPKTTVFCYFANHFIPETSVEKTMVYFKPKRLNTIVKFYGQILNPPAGKEGFYSYQSSIPIGLEGTFLAVSLAAGKFYAEMKDVTINAPEPGKNYTSFTFSPNEVSQADLIQLIEEVNTK